MAQHLLGSPRSNRKTFFGLPLYLAENFTKIPKVPGAQCDVKSGPAITLVIRVTIYCTIFNNNSIIYLQLPSLYAQNTFKKIATENADRTNH